MGEKPGHIPQDYSRILVVSSMEELFDAEFGGPDQINCILLPRQLSHDFNALASAIDRRAEKSAEQRIKALAQDASAPAAVRFAAQALLDDVAVMDQQARRIHVPFRYGVIADRTLKAPPPDAGNYIWHGDGTSTVPFGRLLAAYTKPTTEWARNEDVTMRLVRGSPSNKFNLKAGAQIYHFEPGDIWRQAGIEEPNGVPPFIHRASHEVQPTWPSRLLLKAA